MKFAALGLLLPALALACPAGQVAVMTRGDTSFGADGPEDCVQMCTMTFALQWMPQFVEGTCESIGYTAMKASKTITPAGSPIPVDVTIYTKGETVTMPTAEKMKGQNGKGSYGKHSSGHSRGHGGHGQHGSGHMDMYIQAFWESEEGQRVAEYKERYVAGDLQEGDEDFEDWKHTLMAACPWYKMMEAKYQAGEIDEAFPFLGMLKSGDGKVWSGDLSTPSDYPLDMTQIDWSEYQHHDVDGESHIEHFKNSIEGQWMAEMKAAFVDGDINEDDIEYEFWREQLMSKCPWYKMMQNRADRGEIDSEFPFFDQLKSGAGAAWSGTGYGEQKSPQEAEELHSLMREMKGGMGYHGQHGGLMHGGGSRGRMHGGSHNEGQDHIAQFKKSTQGKWMAKKKMDYVNGLISDTEFQYWKEQLMEGCPWYQLMRKKSERGEIDSEFPFFEELKSGDGPAWSGDYSDDAETEKDKRIKEEMFDIVKDNWGGKDMHGMHGGKHGKHAGHGFDYVSKFKHSIEGQWMAKKKMDYVTGAISEEDIEFKYWHEQLLTQCPWYKMMQNKVDRGEIDSVFPFLDQLSSGDGPVWTGEKKHNQDPADMQEMMKIFSEMRANKGHGHHSYDMEEHDAKVQELIDTCPTAAKKCGVALSDDDEGDDSQGQKDKMQIMREHMDMFECLMDVDPDTVSDECNDLLESYEEMYDRMQGKMSRYGGGMSHGSYNGHSAGTHGYSNGHGMHGGMMNGSNGHGMRGGMMMNGANGHGMGGGKKMNGGKKKQGQHKGKGKKMNFKKKFNQARQNRANAAKTAVVNDNGNP